MALPSEGPAAARINPAELADVHIASFAYGHSGSVSGKVGSGYLQLAVGTPWDLMQLPVRLSAGLGYMSNGSVIDGTNAVYQEAEYDPSLAVRVFLGPEDQWHLAAGLAFDILEFNAFNAVHSNSLGIDAGASASCGLGTAGRLGAGFAYHDWKSPRVRLPENAGDYKIRGWKEYSLDWSSPARFVRARFGLFFQEDGDPEEGRHWRGEWGLNDWETEVRLISWLALKAERTHVTYMSNLGAVLYLPRDLTGCDSRLELNLGHSGVGASAIPSPLRQILLLDKGIDEGLGWLVGASLSVGI